MPPPRPVPTHFLCIPLATAASRPQLTESLASFHADVTSPTSFAIPPGAVRPPGTIHFTLGMMSFPKNEGIDEALELLKSLKPTEILASIKQAAVPTDSAATTTEPASRSQALTTTLKGLQPMQQASKATILYAPPEEPLGSLQAFCERVRAVFDDAGLLIKEDRPLLLHATILNTIYVKGRGGGHGKKRPPRLTIDARGILDRYDDQIWMRQVEVERIAICKMGAKPTGEEGFAGVEDAAYEVEGEVCVD